MCIPRIILVVSEKVKQTPYGKYNVAEYKGHFGNGSFVLSSEVVLILEVHHILIVYQHYNVYIG